MFGAKGVSQFFYKLKVKLVICVEDLIFSQKNCVSVNLASPGEFKGQRRGSCVTLWLHLILMINVCIVTRRKWDRIDVLKDKFVTFVMVLVKIPWPPHLTRFVIKKGQVF